MSCGYEMTELAPGEGQYVDVKDRHVLQILQFIFQTEEGNFAHSIWEVRVHTEFTLQTDYCIVCRCLLSSFSRMHAPLFSEVAVLTTQSCQVTSRHCWPK